MRAKPLIQSLTKLGLLLPVKLGGEYNMAVANAFHECLERKKVRARDMASDVPIRVNNRWVIMVVTDRDNNTDVEVPIAFCPWCGLDLEKAHQTYKKNLPGVRY